MLNSSNILIVQHITEARDLWREVSFVEINKSFPNALETNFSPNPPRRYLEALGVYLNL